jgi:HTH-type transcriptional regulator / antitoxin HipB
MPTTIRIETATDLGLAIRARRKADGLTLVDMAGLTNVGVRFLSELENGKPTVRLDKVLQVVQALGLGLALDDPAPTRQDPTS